MLAGIGDLSFRDRSMHPCRLYNGDQRIACQVVGLEIDRVGDNVGRFGSFVVGGGSMVNRWLATVFLNDCC